MGIGGMEEVEFQKHVEALAARRLEKPKKMVQRNTKLWNEISAGLYNFDRDRVEVEELRTITKDDVLDFYRNNIAVSGGMRKLSCQVLSTAEGGAGEEDRDEVGEVGRDMSTVKSSLGRHSLPQPFLPLEYFQLQNEMYDSLQG